MKLHKSITVDRVLEAAESQLLDLSNPGFCVACGSDADGCEPDLQRAKCHSCGEFSVFGAENLLIMIS